MGGGNKKAEMMNTQRDTWQVIADYPLGKGFIISNSVFKKFNLIKVDSYISHAPIVFIREAFYVFGGRTHKSSFDNQIGKLDANSVWSKVGDLQTGRNGHNAIFDGTYALIIGGWAGSYVKVPTEKCSLTSDGISCTSQNPSLYYYFRYPELFMIPYDYCKKLP